MGLKPMKFDAWKFVLLVLWGLIFANLIHAFPDGMAKSLRVLGVLFVVVHIAEYLFFFKTISSRPENPAVAFLMTFFFGIFYWKDYPAGARNRK